MGRTLKGTVLKMAVNFSYPDDPSLTLDDIDFSVDYYFNPMNLLHFPKEALFREETTVEDVTSVNWFAYVDTGAISGSGTLMFSLEAIVPDSNLPEHTRREIVEESTGEYIYIR